MNKLKNKILTPEERIKKINQVQNLAVKSWLDSGGNGTLMMATGTGKGITSFKCIYAALKKGWIQKGDSIRIWAERENREKTFFEDEAPKFKELYGYDVLEDFNLSFRCYQSGYTAYASGNTVEFEIYDEIDTALSEVYKQCIENADASYKLGLTATNTSNSTVMRSEVSESLHNKVRQLDRDTNDGNITDLINKGQLLKVLLPTVYVYNLDQAVADGVLSGYQTVVINHQLDSVKKYVPKSKTNPGNIFYTETVFWKKRHWMLTDYKIIAGKRIYTISKKVRDITAHQMTSFLYNLESKIPVVQALLYLLKGKKVLIFSPRKKLLYKITDNVCESNNVGELIEKFNKKDIEVIASASMITRGITLDTPDAMILMGYNGISTDLEQKLGRMLRYSYGAVKSIYIIKTEGTFETKWFDKFTKRFNDLNDVQSEINLNIIRELKSEEIIKIAKAKKQKDES